MSTKIHFNNINFRHIAAFVILAGAVFISYAIVARATSPDDIVFPVPELGNCKNEAECKTFCDKPQNIVPCVAFAEKHNLMSKDEAAKAKAFAKMGKGPGGCTSKDSCETFCNEANNMDACIDFAAENGLMEPDELAEARKIQQALRKGAKMPGDCKNKSDCEVYCENPENMAECIEFAEDAGLIPPDELEDARKALEAVKKGVRPPPCRGKKQCDEYCGRPENMEACIIFAEAAGFIPPDEVDDARKMLEALKKGVKPLPCRGKEDCDKWCEEGDNMAQCIEFAAAAGFMSEEEATMARKTGGKGPGGCKSKESCEAFCADPANGESCFKFGMEHGLIPEEQLREMEEGRQQLMEVLGSAPPQVAECIDSQLGAGVADQLKAGDSTVMMRFGQRLEGVIRPCFEQMMQQMGPPGGDMGPGGGPPGGAMPSSPSSGVIVKKGALGITVMMNSADGIQEFLIQPTSGSSYSGGLSGCPKQYAAETNFGPDAYPLDVSVTNCEGETNTINVSAEGRYKLGEDAGGFTPGGEFRPSEGMMPPGGGAPGEMMAPPSQDQIQKMIQERTQEGLQQQMQEMMPQGVSPELQPQIQEQIQQQMQLQIQQQIQQQMQQQLPPQSSILERVGKYLFGLLLSVF